MLFRTEVIPKLRQERHCPAEIGIPRERMPLLTELGIRFTRGYKYAAPTVLPLIESDTFSYTQEHAIRLSILATTLKLPYFGAQ